MNIDYTGKIFQITSLVKNGKTFEWSTRAPGTRTIIDNGKEVLLIEEFRAEQNKLDLRLPGGKVFNTLEEFVNNKEDIGYKAKEGALREVKEETGIVLEDLELLHLSKCGATVVWDLYYFVSKGEIKQAEQSLEHDEKISAKWFSYEEAISKCLDGSVNEDRSLGILLKYLLNKKKL